MTHLALISLILFLAASGATYYLQNRYGEEIDTILEREDVAGFATAITMIEGGGIITGIVYVIWYLIG